MELSVTSRVVVIIGLTLAKPHPDHVHPTDPTLPVALAPSPLSLRELWLKHPTCEHLDSQRKIVV